MSTTSLKDYLFVGLQLLLFLAYAYPYPALAFSRPDGLGNLGLLLAVICVLTGCAALTFLWKKFSPFPTPAKDGELITSGPFALARHPIYTCIVLAAWGYALYCGSGGRMIVGGLLLVLFYFKSDYEEELLGAQYPGYAAYQAEVGRFIKWI